MPAENLSPETYLTPAARMAVIYLCLPLIIFLLGWFQWWFSVPSCALLLVSLSPLLRGEWSRPNKQHLMLFTLAAGWVMLTGAGGWLDTNTNADWIKNDAILLDMTRGSWPTLLPTEGNRPEPMLRYYLGYYMLPAAVGRWLGLSAMSWALALWTITGIYLVFAMLAERAPPGRWLLLGLSIFVFFSGADILRVLIFDDLASLRLGRTHLEWAYPEGLHVQYSSNMTGLMYVPQHFLPAALMACLLMQWYRNAMFCRIAGVLSVSILFWSPFVGLGLLPFIAVFCLLSLRSLGWSPMLSWPNLLLCLPLLIILYGYLSSGPTAFRSEWIWQRHEVTELLLWMPEFLISQFLLLSATLVYLNRALLKNPWFLAANGTLLLLPWYSYGFFNDLAMRASMPALLMLCLITVQSVWQQRALRKRLQPLFVVLCLGAVTGLFEVSRVLRLDDSAWRDYDTLDYTTLSTVHRFFRGQYRGSEQPQWLQTIMKQPPR